VGKARFRLWFVCKRDGPAQDFCHPVQEIRIDTIEKRDDLSIVLNIGVAGISFEDSTVFVDIH